MLAWLVLTGWISAQAAPEGAAAPTSQRARLLVLPVQVVGPANDETVTVARGLERSLTSAMARHSGMEVLGRTELAALLSAEARSELAGCDATNCVAEVGDALGAELAVVSQLGQVEGLWSLQCTLVERRGAQARRRSAVRARSLDGLLQSVEPVARHLSAGSSLSLADPKARERLGTDERGLQLLKEAAARDPERDVAALWTDVIIRHNRESQLLALAEGGLLLAGGMTFILWAGVFGSTQTLYTTVTPQIVSREWDDVVAPSVVPPRSRMDDQGRVPYPWLMAVTALLLPLPLLVAAHAAGAGALALALVDAQDRGRVPVSAQGCCRDELEVREAARPGAGHRAAAVLAALGGFAALGAPACYCAVVIPCFRLWPSDAVLGPTVALAPDTFEAIYALQRVVAFTLLATAGLPYAAGALGAVTALFLTERSDVVDE
ncbi:MAG: hypothetical protein AB2A00_09930 [Myxococcota bacterium]